ncbi:restriction endonuclease subunit S [Aeromonas caviae]|uniref:restriction endonuclease subunit S n=1 Tax=Aeromonas caviae TaxID=648 RepID=UPI00116356EC|nr:restriction endonuclease subunit S [Aeromonas caviae]QDO76822.1 restriction endonuclease subunit S [Aeromonas caviae]
MIEQLITDHLDLWSSAVRPKSSAGRGSNSKLELTGIKKLRELILELAVRGKLVPQDPNDEPASVLLERMAAEKAKLVKEGKIKKSKPLPEITEEEKPFELPEGWGVVRLGEIGLWATGNGFPTIEQGFDDLEILFCKVSDMNLDGNERVIYKTTNTVSQETVNRLKLNLHQKGTVIFPKIGGAIATNKRRVIIRPTAIDNNCLGISPLSCVASNYLFLLLTSIKMEEYQVGTSVPAISQSSLELITLGLPPIDEQHRIVAKVDELMSLCDQLEQQSEASLAAHQTLVETLLTTLTDSADSRELAQNWARLAQHFDSLFTTQSSIDALKQTILQLAVMGKLVPQDPNDEPASVLLERIAAEKARLIKEGKIKKEKPLPPISEEEKPFALPDGWEWCRFEDVVDIQSGITKGRNLTGRKLVSVPYLSVANVQRGYVDLSGIKTIELPEDEINKYKVIARDLLITEGGDWDKVGRTAIWKEQIPYVAHQNHVFKARILLQEQDEVWLEKFLNGPFARDYFAGSSKQTTNLASINKTQLRGCLIAVPPREEKERIVAKVDELMSLCDQLSARLQASQTTQLHLAEALVEGALN